MFYSGRLHGQICVFSGKAYCLLKPSGSCWAFHVIYVRQNFVQISHICFKSVMGINLVKKFISKTLPGLWTVIFEDVLVAKLFKSIVERGSFFRDVLDLSYSIKDFNEFKPLQSAIRVIIHILLFKISSYECCIYIWLLAVVIAYFTSIAKVYESLPTDVRVFVIRYQRNIDVFKFLIVLEYLVLAHLKIIRIFLKLLESW